MPRKSKKARDLILAEPKPVAKMRVSVSGKNITKLEVPRSCPLPSSAYVPSISSEREEGESSSTSSKKKKSKFSSSKTSKKKMRSREEAEAIDHIWECLSNGDIDLKYATVGYGFNSRSILDHDIFVNLLINYGFTIGIILDFIDDFNEVSLENDDFPMVMVNSHMTTIYNEVGNLDKSKSDESKS